MAEQRVDSQTDSYAALADVDQQRARLAAIVADVLLVLFLAYGARAFFSAQNRPLQLTIYAFSTQEEALTQSLLPAFEARWEAESGRQLNIHSVFGPSSTLAGQIVLGSPADIALFSNAHHVTYLRVGKRIPQAPVTNDGTEHNESLPVSRT